MAVLHGRSKECKFQGTADYRKIRSVVETVYPIFANGDINDLDSAILAAEKSGSDGLMIGRGAIGQPWILHAGEGVALDRRAARCDKRASRCYSQLLRKSVAPESPST